MKVKMYMDVYKGQDKWFGATSQPSADPIPSVTRFHFTVDIPDSALKWDEGQYTHVENLQEVE